MSEPTQQVAQVTFTLTQVVAFVGGIVSLAAIVIGFFIRRSVFKEIDDLKENKQAKPHCEQQKALCNQETQTMCEDVKEIKSDLKEGRKEFSQINRKIERLMASRGLKYDDLNKENPL